jgi:epoxyqueuosine reductase
MALKASQTAQIISQAESYDGICAGIVRLDDVLKGPSHRADPPDPQRTVKAVHGGDRRAKTHTVLILGLHHPRNDPGLDEWERGNSPGNRRLMEISGLLKLWLKEACGVIARPMPYHVEKGGLFLKDAAALSGIGVIGRNNLLLHPAWGPRIRLRALLLRGDLEPTRPLEDFDPCKSCKGFCQKACPVKAFPRKKYHRLICSKQILYNEKKRVPKNEIGMNGRRITVIRYCRACEMACPV